MRRGTTPTHTFLLPLAAADVKKIRVIYCQDGENVLTREDAEISGNIATLQLTQEETLKFNSESRVEIQVRLLAEDDEALASNIITVRVDRLLESEVLV